MKVRELVRMLQFCNQDEELYIKDVGADANGQDLYQKVTGTDVIYDDEKDSYILIITD